MVTIVEVSSYLHFCRGKKVSSDSICVLGYGNPNKVAHSNQQKHTFTTGSVGTFLLIAACHLIRVSVAQGTYTYLVT